MRAISRDTLIALVLGVILLGSLPWLLHPWFDLTNDAAMYVLTARSLANGEGYTMLGMPFAIRPPGFSALIAPILAARGTDFLALNAFVSLCGAVAVYLLFVLERPRLGAVLASLVALGIWLNPGFRRFSNQVMSDVPGLAALLGCLCLERWAARRPCLRRELLLGLCIGLATWVRVMNALLVPALVVSRLARGRSPDDGWGRFVLRRVAPAAVVATLTWLPWPVRNALHPAPAPADQTLLYSYATALWHRDPGDPSSPRLDLDEFAARAEIVPASVAGALGTRLSDAEPGPLELGFAALLVAGGIVALARRREPSDFVALGALLVLCGYFAFDPRMLLPVYVLLLPAALFSLREGLGARVGPVLGRAAAAALALALLAVDFEPRRGWEEVRSWHERFQELSVALEEKLAPDARVGAALGWYYAVFMERPVWSLHFAILRQGDLPKAVEQTIDAYDLDAVIVSPYLPEEHALTEYLRACYGVPRRQGVPALVKVRPSGTPGRCPHSPRAREPAPNGP